jgi:hypothetical protein
VSNYATWSLGDTSIFKFSIPQITIAATAQKVGKPITIKASLGGPEDAITYVVTAP